jgi:hypothetical protein
MNHQSPSRCAQYRKPLRRHSLRIYYRHGISYNRSYFPWLSLPAPASARMK